MRRLDLSLEELGSARLLVYNGSMADLDNNIAIRNVLKFKRTTFVDVPLVYFDLTNLVSLAEIQKFTLDKYDILNLLYASASVAKYCQNNSINLAHILFDPFYTFVDNKFNIFFLPLKVENEDGFFEKFLKDIIVNSIIDPRSKDNFVQLLLNCLNDPKFSVDIFIKLLEQLVANNEIEFKSSTRPLKNLEELSKDFEIPKFQAPTSKVNNHLQPQIIPSEQDNDDDKYPVNKFPNPYQRLNPEKTVEPADVNFGPLVVGESPSRPQQTVQKQPPPIQLQEVSSLQEPQPQMETNFFTPQAMSQVSQYNSQQEQPVLKRNAFLVSGENRNQNIPIDTDIFALGRNPEIVNYSINSPFVGRLHAIISYENGKYFVVDKNSTNGTYVNNQRLQPEVRQQINNMDIIKLAKHAFQFNIA